MPSIMQSKTPTLRLATFSDLPSIARCWYHAFFDDEIIGEMMHPHRKEYPEDVYYFLLRGIRERFWDWRHQFIVVTLQNDGEERVAGAADWRRVGEGGKSMELWWGDPREWHSHSRYIPEWPVRMTLGWRLISMYRNSGESGYALIPSRVLGALPKSGR